MLEFIGHVISPAIDGLPVTAGLLSRCADCLEALDALRTPTDRLDDILDEGVYLWMHNSELWQAIEEHGPDVAARLRELASRT
jgi:hypothetical protein